MAVVGSLEVQLEASAKNAAGAIDELSKKFDGLLGRLTAFGKNTGINALGEQAKELSKNFEDVGAKLKESTKSIEPQMKNISKTLEQFKEQYANLGKGFVFKGSVSDIQKQIDKYTNSLETAKLKKEELETAGKTEGKAYEAAIAKTIEYTNVIESLKQQLAEMQTTQPQLNFNISGIEETRQAIEAIGESIRESVSIPESAFNYNADAMTAVFGEAAGNIENWAQGVEAFGERAGRIMNESAQLNFNVNGIEEARQEIVEISGAVSQVAGNIPIIGQIAKQSAFIGQKAFEGLKFAMSSIVSVGKGVASVFLTVGAAAKNLASKLKSAMSGFTGLSKSSKGLNVSLAGGFRTLLRYAFGIRSVYALVNKLRRAIVDGFKNLVVYSDEVNASLSMLKGSLETLKNASAAALSPLLNALAPALNTIIQLCIRAANAVNQFLSALFGKGTWTRAKDQIVDVADGIKKAGKAAQKSVRQFDELKLISTDSGGDSGTDAGDMFEEVPIDDKVLDWMDRLRQMWKNADFTELGSTIGDWLKNALDNIPWDEIKTKAAKLGKGFATLLNGIFETEGLGYSIGVSIAESINTAFEFLNEFVHNLNWSALGQFVAESLNGLFENLDWELITDTFFAGAKGLADAINSFDEFLNWDAIASTISNFFNTLVGTIRIFVGNVDWKALGADIGKTISDAWTGINWGEVGATLGESFIAFFDFISSAIENVDWQGVAQTVEDFVTGIDWSGVASSFFEGLGAAFGALSAVLGKLFYDAIDGAKKYFHDKIVESGGNVAEGILVGIAEALVNIGNWIYEHVFEPFITGFKNAFGIHSPSTVMQEQGGFIMQGLLEGISSLVQNVIDIFNSIKEKIVEVWGTIKTKTSEIWNGIKTFVSSLWTGLKTNVSSVFGSIKTTITNIWNGIKTVTTNVWNGIKNAIKTPINAIIGFVNGMIDGVVGGINSLTGMLNKLKIDIPDNPFTGPLSIGFDIPQISVPQIPYLGKGGIAMQYTPAIIGEAGEEAILPLTNPRAMSMIAESILSNFNGGSYNTFNSSGDAERRAYDIVYNAITTALMNSKTMRDILDEIKKGHTIEMDGRRVAETVRKEANMYFRSQGTAYFDF